MSVLGLELGHGNEGPKSHLPPPSHPSLALLIEIPIVSEAGGVPLALERVVPVADKLLPGAAVTLGYGGVVELLGRDALQGLSIACDDQAQGVGHAGGRGHPVRSPPPHPQPEDLMGRKAGRL